jgi:hypothetical protein
MHTTVLSNARAFIASGRSLMGYDHAQLKQLRERLQAALLSLRVDVRDPAIADVMPLFYELERREHCRWLMEQFPGTAMADRALTELEKLALAKN